MNVTALYIASWVSFVSGLLRIRAYILQTILDTSGGLSDFTNAVPDGDASFYRFYDIAQCADTATLTLNVSSMILPISRSRPNQEASRVRQFLFANSITCWWVSRLYRGRLAIRILLSFLLSATFCGYHFHLCSYKRPALTYR